MSYIMKNHKKFNDLTMINGEMFPYSEKGNSTLVFYNISTLISFLSFIRATVTVDFPTDTEIIIFNLGEKNRPQYETWFTLTSTGNLSIPCRLTTNGDVILCNYTGQNLQNFQFYGQLVYYKNPLPQ